MNDPDRAVGNTTLSILFMFFGGIRTFIKCPFLSSPSHVVYLISGHQAVGDPALLPALLPLRTNDLSAALAAARAVALLKRRLRGESFAGGEKSALGRLCIELLLLFEMVRKLTFELARNAVATLERELRRSSPGLADPDCKLEAELSRRTRPRVCMGLGIFEGFCKSTNSA